MSRSQAAIDPTSSLKMMVDFMRNEKEESSLALIKTVEKKALTIPLEKNGKQLVHFAAEFGCSKFIYALQKDGELNLPQLTTFYKTTAAENNFDYLTDNVDAVILAAVNKKYEVLRTFYDLGAQMNSLIMQQNAMGQTLIHYASQKGDVQLMQTLIAVMAKDSLVKNLLQGDIVGQSAFDVASGEEMKKMLSSYGADKKAEILSKRPRSELLDEEFPVFSQIPLGVIEAAASAAGSSVGNASASQLLGVRQLEQGFGKD